MGMAMRSSFQYRSGEWRSCASAAPSVGCIVVQVRHPGDELMNQAECRVDVERKQVLLRHREHAREAHAGNPLGDDRELGAIARMLDVIDAGDVLAAHMCKAIQAFPEEELERWDGREDVAEHENVD